ncbi:MAG: hypothetical protein RR949_01895 [Oscillospiraceae bacterium]
MKTTSMAVVVPVENPAQDDAASRTLVWSKVVELLKPGLGKLYHRFQPATAAWAQALSHPLGVVMGKTEPALFLYLYGAAKVQQGKAINFHMDSLLGELEPGTKIQDGKITGYVVEVKGDGENLGPHLLWHMGMMTGALLPDCGVYYLAHKEAFAADALDREVLTNVPGYALCMVTLAVEETA